MGKRSRKRDEPVGSSLVLPRSSLAKPIGRREFVRTTGGILVAASLGGACADGGPGMGRVRVTITGLTPGFNSAGTAVITGDDIAPINVELIGRSTAEESVRAGTYHVVYTPPVGYAMAPGNANEIDVTVVPDGDTPIAFAVVAASGSLHLVVQGLTGGVDGGSAQVVRTGIPNATPITILIPESGTIDQSLVPGTYSVSYNSPAGHQLAPGQTNPRNTTVPDGGSASVTFEVTQSATPTGVIFNSDWSTATGTGASAIRDGSRWTIAQQLEVVPSTGLDFPSANCLKVLIGTTSGVNSFPFMRKTGLGVPAVGTSRYYRWYSRVTIPDGMGEADSETHPHQDGNAASDCNWLFKVHHNDGTNQWRPHFEISGGPYPYDDWFAGFLNKNQTYRFEYQVHRTGANTFQIHIRVFDGGGAPVWSDSNWLTSDTRVPLNGQPLNFRAVSNMDGFNAGLNGLGGTDWHPSVIYMYQGCVAIKDSTNNSNDWIGPYSGGI